MPYTLHGPLPVMDESMVHAAIDHCVVGGEGAWLRPLTTHLPREEIVAYQIQPSYIMRIGCWIASLVLFELLRQA